MYKSSWNAYENFIKNFTWHNTSKSHINRKQELKSQMVQTSNGPIRGVARPTKLGRPRYNFISWLSKTSMARLQASWTHCITLTAYVHRRYLQIKGPCPWYLREYGPFWPVLSNAPGPIYKILHEHIYASFKWVAWRDISQMRDLCSHYGKDWGHQLISNTSTMIQQVLVSTRDHQHLTLLMASWCQCSDLEIY